MSTYENVIEMVTEFIAVRKESKGGYAPVETDEVRQLAEIMKSLIELKYEEDPDGDMPIEFRIVDRTRFESHIFDTVPYDSWCMKDTFDEDSEDVDKQKKEHDLRRLRKLHFNASVANDRLDRSMRLIMNEMEDELKKKN